MDGKRDRERDKKGQLDGNTKLNKTPSNIKAANSYFFKKKPVQFIYFFVKGRG